MKDNEECKAKISTWLGKIMKVSLTDGRTLVGQFLCTDNARNVILGSAQEYLAYSDTSCKENPRVLGLAMVPGKHILSMQIDQDIRKDNQDDATIIT